MANGPKSEAQREAAALLLARGFTIKATAKKTGIGQRTLGGWLTDDTFASRVRALQRQLVSRTVGRLASAGGKAVKALVGRLDDQAEKGAVKVSAATAILNQLFRGTDVVELAQHVEELERLLLAQEHEHDPEEPNPPAH
jgi:hypothetical protein